MNKTSQHELMDRASIQVEQFGSSILEHVDFTELPILTQALCTQIQSKLVDLYQKLGQEMSLIPTPEYTEGVLYESGCVLKNGKLMTITEILNTLKEGTK